MNKKFLLLGLVLLMSCGEEVPRADQSFKNLGQIVAVDSEENLTTGDVDLLQRVCDALASKESFFKSAIINKKLSYTYVQSESSCGAEPSPVEVEFEITSDNGQLAYSSSSATPLFNYVETESYGSLEVYCNKLGEVDVDQGIDGVPRYLEEGKMVNIISLFTDRSSVCSGDNDTICAFVQFAYKLDDGNYRVDQIVKLSIDTNDRSTPKGIVEEKEVAEVCSSDSAKQSTRKITLKQD